MSESGAFLSGLRERYRAYEAEVEELERNRKPFEGILGMKGGPADNPCHDRFAEELRAQFADFAASGPDSAEVRSVLDFVYREPLDYPGANCANWMLQAVQSLTKELIPFLTPEDADALAGRFEEDYPSHRRLPVQVELLKLLRKAGTAAQAAPRFPFSLRRKK